MLAGSDIPECRQGYWGAPNIRLINTGDAKVTHNFMALAPYANFIGIDPYLANNDISRNIALGNLTRMTEGSSLYTFMTGPGNAFRENIMFKTGISFDSGANNNSSTGDLLVGNGRGKVAGIHRGKVHGTVIKDSVKCNEQTGLEPMNKLYAVIKADVDKEGGWLGRPSLEEWTKKLKALNYDQLSEDDIKSLKEGGVGGFEEEKTTPKK